MDDESVDFVLATEFLEHYFDTEKILVEIKRVLKPGGVLFSVPNVLLHETYLIIVLRLTLWRNIFNKQDTAHLLLRLWVG
jgi:ubiquinone/menaquinone biosynthesis C-methylase UbiE